MKIHKALGATLASLVVLWLLGEASLDSSGTDFAAVSVFHITNFVASASAGEVGAQDEALQPGEAYVTRFSGTAGAGSQTAIDVRGTVGSIIDLRGPAQAPRGQHWINEPQRNPVTAGQVGQVFGVILDDAQPPNVYLTATAAFGLHRTADNSGWMPGMWGPNAGPGAVWKLDAANNYAPSLLTTIKLDGRENTGAALGNIAYDSKHKQLFVSDLESGMIHRLGLDGKDLGHFDHGTAGRKSFIDAATGAQSSLPEAAFDPSSAAKIQNCPGGDFAKTPECWNLADFRRRVWGVGVHQDKTGNVRLFYAVWSSQAFGNPAFNAAGDDEKRNSIWSIGISDDGAFDLTSVRREFFLPDFFTDPNDIARAGRSNPVSDIAFCKCSDQDIMIVAERGGMRNLGLTAENPFATPHESRVLRYEPDEKGVWQLKGRYDVGFYDRKNEKEPFLRANSSGGADFGYGYTTEWRFDPQKPNEFVWMTGDSLCSGYAPCFAPDTGKFEDGSEVHGIEGIPLIAFDELLPAAATQPYPKSGQPTDAIGPSQSWMVDTDINVENGKAIMESLLRNDATKIGDIAIYELCPGAEQPPATQPPPNVEQPPVVQQPPAAQGPDLSKQKTGPAECVEGNICTYTITITNNGPGTWSGPLWERDTLPPGALLANFNPQPDWICAQGVGSQDVICNHTFVTLQPGESVTLTIDVLMPLGIAGQTVQNCVADIWLPSTDPNDPGVILAIEQALSAFGYPVGPIDGILDVDTMAAISQFQAANGLPVTGVPDRALIDLLFPGSAAAAGDANPNNDQSCAQTPITPIGPVLERAQPPAQPQAAAPDLEIKKQQLGKLCLPGNLCSFALVLINQGPGNWSGQPAITDVVPAGATFVSSSAWSCSQNDDRVVCSDPLPVTLAPGQRRIILITLRLPRDLKEGGQNCGEITWQEGSPADANPGNNRACIPIRVGGAPTSDLEARKVQSGQCQPGGLCGFDLWFVNRGPAPWTGRPQLRDQLPSGAVLQDGSACSTSAIGVTCQGPEVTLPPETGVHFSVKVKMPEHLDPGTKNCVHIDWPAGAQHDPVPQNDEACIPIAITPAPLPVPVPLPPALPPIKVGPGPDTTIEKTQLGVCRAGGICSFELRFINVGPGEWSGRPTLSETMLAGASLSQSSPSSWKCNPNGSKLTCSNSDGIKLAQGDHFSLILSIRVPASLTDGAQNCANVEPPAEGPADSHHENDTSCIPVQVTPTPTYTPHPPSETPPPAEAPPLVVHPPAEAPPLVVHPPGAQPCPAGTHLQHGRCVQNAAGCPSGTVKRGKRCVPVGRGSACPHGTVRRGNICVPMTTSCPGGTIRLGTSCVPIAPLIETLPGIVGGHGGGGGGHHHHQY
jgi:peptidoglycan hydrolase-like protein with peptidoglycan-binding domain